MGLGFEKVEKDGQENVSEKEKILGTKRKKESSRLCHLRHSPYKKKEKEKRKKKVPIR